MSTPLLEIVTVPIIPGIESLPVRIASPSP